MDTDRTRTTIQSIRSTEGLIKAGLVEPHRSASLKAVEESFLIRLTPQVQAQINTADAQDPVFAQYVPDEREVRHKSGELQDPVGDEVFEQCKGLTHRYPDRVLLKPTHTCQVYCRFCFRREQVGQPEQALNEAELAEAIDYIGSNPSIWEVILTGGDPLVLSDRRLEALLQALASIEHVALIRIHTRIPLVAPERITRQLTETLKRSGKTVCFVIHVNHGNELSEAVDEALATLIDSGFPVYSQTVLLKGVNDDAQTLAALFRQLMSRRVKPYYLHHLDKARGVDHFRISIQRGQEIMTELRGRLSGICIPTYVLDIPGGYGKVPIGPEYIVQQEDGHYRVKDYLDVTHAYRELAE